MSSLQLVIDAAAELLVGNDPKKPAFTTLQSAPDELKDEIVKLYFCGMSESDAVGEFAEIVAEAASSRHLKAIGDSAELGNVIANDLYHHVEFWIAEEVRQQIERLQRQALKDTDTDSKIDHIKDTRSAA